MIFIAAALYPAGLSSVNAASATSRQVRRQERSAAGRTLTRQLLETATGLPGRDWDIAADVDGRPMARKPGGGQGPDVSISHSANVVCCAVALEGRVGIDVEDEKPKRRYPEISETFFSAEEQRVVQRDGVSGFLGCWVLREAYAKATGIGLSHALGMDGSWTAAVRHATALIDIGRQQWIVGHRSWKSHHIGIAWLPRDSDETKQSQVDAALEAALGMLGRH
jgi:4'-phosphopantetheinyl transferase superfamily